MTLADVLREHDRAWRARPFVRELYREWFELIASRLSAVDGRTVELGSGLGAFRDVVPAAIATDVEATPWSSAVVDAAALPYDTGSVANLVLVDVFHHLPDPAAFLDEAVRALAPGGRVVLLEPYCSPLSTLAYRFHHEHMDLGVDPFASAAQSSDDPMDANLALSTLAFFRHRGELERCWPDLRVLATRRLALLAYPLSGGFTRRPLAPPRLLGLLRRAERLLVPMAPVAAFRCLVVLGRR